MVDGRRERESDLLQSRDVQATRQLTCSSLERSVCCSPIDGGTRSVYFVYSACLEKRLSLDDRMPASLRWLGYTSSAGSTGFCKE